jgi:hypothetical protein
LPRQHGGLSVSANLAWACRWCNARKGPNIAGIDATTRRLVPLFDPRAMRWSSHFRREGPRIAGITPTGRVTAKLLAMNDEELVEIRQWLLDEGCDLDGGEIGG